MLSILFFREMTVSRIPPDLIVHSFLILFTDFYFFKDQSRVSQGFYFGTHLFSLCALFLCDLILFYVFNNVISQILTPDFDTLHSLHLSLYLQLAILNGTNPSFPKAFLILIYVTKSTHLYQSKTQELYFNSSFSFIHHI